MTLIQPPIPTSLRSVHGGAKLDWIVGLLPLLISLQLEHPTGWKASDLAQVAVDDGLSPEDISLSARLNKVNRALAIFERIQYVQRTPTKLFTANVQRIQAECQAAAEEYSQEVARAQDLSNTMLAVAAMGPDALRKKGEKSPKTLIKRILTYFTD